MDFHIIVRGAVVASLLLLNRIGGVLLFALSFYTLIKGGFEPIPVTNLLIFSLIAIMALQAVEELAVSILNEKVWAVAFLTFTVLLACVVFGKHIGSNTSDRTTVIYNGLYILDDVFFALLFLWSYMSRRLLKVAT